MEASSLLGLHLSQVESLPPYYVYYRLICVVPVYPVAGIPLHRADSARSPLYLSLLSPLPVVRHFAIDIYRVISPRFYSYGQILQFSENFTRPPSNLAHVSAVTRNAIWQIFSSFDAVSCISCSKLFLHAYTDWQCSSVSSGIVSILRPCKRQHLPHWQLGNMLFFLWLAR